MEKTPRKKLYQYLTFQVLVAITIGILVGYYLHEQIQQKAIDPGVLKKVEAIGKTFINMIKMLIAPIIFLTIVIGIGKVQNMKKFGRIGGKALGYFLIVTTIALCIGVLTANIIKPGSGIDPEKMKKEDVSQYVEKSKEKSWVDHITEIVPPNVVGAFAEGNLLQVLFFSILFGVAVSKMGEAGQSLVHTFEKILHALFKVLGMIMILAPIGAFGGMAYTIGKYGLETLIPLGKLMLSVYLTMIVFIFVVLNLICRSVGISLWHLLGYIKEEILIVLGTSSSESVLPRMIEKMERYGCSAQAAGLVIPTGYSFNLDGTSIYLSMSVLFLAQVFHVNLGLGEQLGIIGVLILTSKGAAGVTGSGFIVLASTLASFPQIPIEGLGLLLGVDRFMSEARSITNLIGNAVATVVIAKSEHEFDPVLLEKKVIE
ncbi:C4-dicarboxylate transporter DctA [Cytophagaceae bacterium YF14B1]|uniref:C4-dicarboxylate transporter DctA n=1 Tax=Xanthocytophaga flava TaxID=3048013 RepID=A0AAE3QWR3_9BACT|nr:C4-dicarboxylate transporter DctA [Xanthocytophaga flavus]MDJ1484601.1 C4-dicarboxylate transporter DctA [Xanthocytophaga flavus]